MTAPPWIVLLLVLRPWLTARGYDAYTSCPRQLRTTKSWPEPPCDFRAQHWCTIPGSAYPWHAVRRFVRENQGLMRRMYGDQRHISVLRAEMESNDVDEVRHRYSDLKGGTGTTTTNSNSTTGSNNSTTTTTTTTPGAALSFVPKERKNHTDGADPAFNDTLDKPSPAPSPPPTLAVTTTTAPAPTTTGPSTLDESTTLTVAASTTEVASTEQQTTEQPPPRKTAPTFFKEKHTAGSQLFPAEAEERMPAVKVPIKLKGVNACPVKEEVVAPFWANNTRGEVLALLNLYPFEQYVHWEKCTFEHKQMYCREGCRCEQQYRLHRLLAYDPKNECRGIFSDWFKFPSCCVCKCYDLPVEFHITSRSPRGPVPHPWYSRAANAR